MTVNAPYNTYEAMKLTIKQKNAGKRELTISLKDSKFLDLKYILRFIKLNVNLFKIGHNNNNGDITVILFEIFMNYLNV